MKSIDFNFNFFSRFKFILIILFYSNLICFDSDFIGLDDHCRILVCGSFRGATSIAIASELDRRLFPADAIVTCAGK